MDPSSDHVTSRFIVKQVTQAEKRTLMKILPAYVRHVTQRNGRSLIQYYGCHSMPLRWRYSAKVYFIVMRNLLPVHTWLTFDLKGATANRRALAAHHLHEVQHFTRIEQASGKAYGTLRDWEWMDIAMAVDVAAHQKAELIETIAADAQFLASQGLLDYSLLLGIHRIPSDLGPDARKVHLEELIACGGYVSLDQQKVYFFGIIDVLERYTARWRVQHAVLTVGYHLTLKGDAADGISALAPRDYADRFQTFIWHEVLQVSSIATEQDDDHNEQNNTGGVHRNRAYLPGSLASMQRWGRLWQRRRRGLVRERIESDRADYIRRIEELEAQLRTARSG